MRSFVLASVLAASVLSAAAAEPSPFERAASLLPPGMDLPEAPEAAAGTAVSSGFSIERAVPFQSALPAQEPAPVKVDIKSILNRTWTNADAMGEGPDKVFLSGQIDLDGNPYLSVFAPSWPSPRFFPIKRGMAGSWTLNKADYSVSLNVSIFRKRLNNYIVIDKSGSGKVLEIRIGELFLATDKAGQDVSLGGQAYRIFYTNNVDTSKDPMVADPDNYGFCFVHDAGSGGEHDFKFYLIARKDIVGKGPVSYKMFDDRVFKFRVTDDLSTLEISQ